jgi:archaellum component FlaC
MATRTKTTKKDSNQDFKKRKSLELRLEKLKENLGKCDNSQEILDEYTEKLSRIWTEIEEVQSNIELCTNSIENELEHRWHLEEIYEQIQIALKTGKGKNTTTTHSISGNVPNINFHPYTQEESFQNFTRRFENYIQLRGNISPRNKVDLFLQAITPQMHEQLYDICIPYDPHEKTYEELTQLLMAQIEPKPSIWARQHKFTIRTQQNDESIQDYANALKKISVDCQFNCDKCSESVSEILLRMQFVKGLKDPDIRLQLLQDKLLQPFKDVVEKAATIELAKMESKIIKPQDNIDADVHQVSGKLERSKNSSKFNENNIQSSNFKYRFEKLKNKCYRCGDESHKANQCRFKNYECNLCKRTGHLARVCLKQNKEVKQCEENAENTEDSANGIYQINSKSNDKFMIKVKVEGRFMPMELDTGAALSIVSYDTFKLLNSSKRIFKTNIQLRTYTGEIIKPRGVAFVDVQYRNQSFVGKLYIVNRCLDSIFGREWIREVKLDTADICTLSSSEEKENIPGLDQLITRYEDIFKEGIGKIPHEKGHLNLNDKVQPIYIKPRHMPYAIQEKVEKELERLKTLGIITQVEHSDWGTPIVPVIKPNGSVRICADYKVTLNKVIKDEHYPIPRIEDIMSKMHGGKIFCTLDISNAYLHLEMDEDSAIMQTISTHKGLFKVNRLMFGVKVAPLVWQRFMDKTLHNLEGVQCFFDDIIIQGSNKVQLLQRLEQVFERLKMNDLRINREKCKFFQSKIEYLGHVIDSEGLHKSDKKIQSILKCKRPENVSELRTFLGLANYYNKFIKNLATLLHPLNKLLQKGSMFNWSPSCESSFQKIKDIITSDDVLVHFNPDLPLILATDASPVGVGAVLSHRYRDGTDRPIAYASRTLTRAEQRYSQIDKEALGIYWGLKKFFSFCYGRKFTLITDHKPLVSIFNPTKTLPTISATRIFNYAHYLSGFDYDIEYRQTAHHSNADYLSRFPTEQTQENVVDDISKYHINQLETINISSTIVAKETLKDSVLGPILQALKSGKSVEEYGFHDNELSIQNDCVMKGWKVMIPCSLRSRVLQELHVAHLGEMKMKALARNFCWWKNMDKDIEEMVTKCRQCIEKKNNPRKIVHPWETPSNPWERVHIDFLGPTDGQQYLILVDAFSKWVEIIQTRTTTSTWTIQELRRIFSTFGFPSILVSDNGRQFVSQEFKNFIDECGIIHRISAPYHPNSNGQAERYVQTIKKALKAMEGEKGTLQNKIQKLLMQLRQSPNATGTSAYHLMFGRSIRTNLSIIVPTIETKKQQKNRIQIGINRNFKVGDRVQARNYVNGSTKWSLGRITAKQGHVMYTVQLDDGRIVKRHIDQLILIKTLHHSK